MTLAGELNLSDLARYLQERLQQPLPGITAHEAMFPASRDEIQARYKFATPPRQGSVLLLLFEENGGIYFPLIKRPAYAGVHGGQVSLPGGKAEPGETALQTALREGEEEIGIVGHKVTAVGQLTSFNVLVSNIYITPIVGIYEGVPEFVPDPHEVDHVLLGSVSQLRQQQEITKREVISGARLSLLAPHFEVQKEVVWGATAMILNEFRLLLRGH
ncbi:MAG: CoA pyrophosphatase [Bacteroidota bacterium]|jgi:8-oxo-dGTP pyrophosphatase MutT (NUDIX family)|nr:MAG: coenzyme A pyrophosphatase [Bacteroidota bacterium]